MALTKPKAFWTLDIDATNNKIDVVISAGASAGTYAATIATASHVSPTTLAAAVQLALTDDGSGGSVNYSSTPPVFTVSISSTTGKMTVSCDVAFRLMWKTGASGSDNTDTSAAYITGFAKTGTVADTASATSATGTYQHQNGWYSDRAVRFDSLEEFVSMDSSAQRSIGGQSQHIDNGEVEERIIRLSLLPDYKTKTYFEPSTLSSDGAAHDNEAIERLWRDGRSTFYWFPDQTINTSTGYVLADETIKEFRPVRHEQKHAYDVTLKLWLRTV